MLIYIGLYTDARYQSFIISNFFVLIDLLAEWIPQKI